jgi:hypothetical protein
MADESNDMGFGSFVSSDEPTKQESAKPETKPTAKKPKDRSITSVPKLEPGVIDPTVTAKQALDAAEVVGSAEAVAPQPASELAGFKSDLTNMGIGAAGLAAIVGTALAGKKLYDRFTAPAPTPEVTPTTPELTPHQQQLNELELQHKRSQIAHIDAKTQKVLQVKPTATPTAAAPPANIAPQPVAPTPPVAQPAQPIVPTQAPAAPLFGKGTDMPLNPFTTDIKKIAQVTNPTTAAMAEVATGKVPEMVGPPTEMVGPVKPPDIATRVRRTAKEIAAAKLSSETFVPPEMGPQYPKTPKNIGPGGYNWLAGQEGSVKAPEVWRNLVGEKNMSYSDLMKPENKVLYEAYKGGYGEPDPFKAASTPGEYKGPKYVPKYIKGGASPAMLASIAGNTLGGIELYKQYKKAKETGDWADFGLGVANQLAANVLPKAGGLGVALMTPGAAGDPPEELKALGERLKKAQQAYKYGAGRGSMGVPPP